MAKALKVAAVVVGVAALAVVTGGAALGLGVSLATTLTIGGAYISAGALLLGAGILTAGAALLQGTPKVTASQTERLTANIDPRAFRKTVLGQTAMPVDVRYEEWSGNDQEYCDWIVALASHAIDGVEEIWLNTDLAWSQTTGPTGIYAGYLSIPNIVLEGSPANAFSFASGKWNAATAHLTGCAYLRMRFKTTGNSKKATSPFSSGIPSRITIIGRGAKLYDPRRDSTLPGGSGPMRADDQSTWRYTADDGAVIGENLPLQILREVLGWRIRNPVSGEMRLATGSGVPARRLDLHSFLVAANQADELVNRSAGGNEPRYRGAAVLSEGDDPKSKLDMLCAACCGRFRDTGGKLALVVMHNDLATAAMDDGLTDDDVVGAFTWDPDAALESTPNVIRGRYVDASSGSLYQLLDYPEVRLPSIDGQDRIFPLDLGAIESPSHAQRVAKQVLQRKQYPREFTAPFDIRAWKYTVGDPVPFTFAPLGFNRRIFRVKEQELGQGGVCNMTLSVEHPSIYAWDNDDTAPVIAAEPNVYDSRNNPLILAIAEAATTATWDGITGADKPADNATNSADPTSPFGLGGTVGGTITKLNGFDTAIAAARARQDTLEHETIPAIDAAVSAAGDRITAARSVADKALADVAAELARASDAEIQINTRIDSVAAQGGYNDTAVYAEVRRVDTTAITRDNAIGQRIDTVSASFQAAKGLTPNADFGAGDAGWSTGGFTFPGYGGGKVASSNAGVYCQLTGLARTKVTDTTRGLRLHCTFRVFGAAQLTYVGLQMFDSTGASIGVTYAAGFAAVLAPGDYSVDQLYVGQWPETSVPQYRVGGSFIPGVNSVVPLFLANYPDQGGPFAGGYVQIESFWVEDVGTAQLTEAKVTQAATAAADANRAIAGLSTSVDTRFTGVNQTLGTYDQRITTLTTGQMGFATRATALEAAAVSGGTSLNANPVFAIWPVGQRLPTGWTDWGDSANLYVARADNTRPDSPYFIATNQAAPNTDLGFMQVVPSLAAAGWYVLYVEAELSAGSWDGAGMTIHGVYNLDFCAAADLAGDVSSTKTGVRRWTWLLQKPADGAVNFHCMQSWSGFGRPRAQKIVSWRDARIRSANDAEVKAGKADAALNNAGGVLSRLSTNEATLADLPNRYAAASRTATLEAQVNFAADSGLQRTLNTRIEDRATAIADAKSGAVAQTVSILRGEYNGTAATVTQQAGAIVGLNGKTSAYVKVVADAGAGRAGLSLWSDQFGGAWSLTGDGVIDGNLTVNGTITARKFDRTSMSRIASSAFSGSVSPPRGQTVTVPWSLGLGVIPPLGRFIYEYYIGVLTNEGQTTATNYNGLPLYTNYIGDGGASVYAQDGQGHGYAPRANASDPVLATSDFNATFVATVSNGNYDSGIVNDGDYYYRNISATYTLQSINLRVTWVAI